MRKIAIYILLLGAASIIPRNGTDVGKLHPVELVQLYEEKDTIVIATDTGAVGKGTSTEDAVANLNATTSGIVFLDTARYLLLSESAKEQSTALECYLKPKVRVCAGESEIDPKEAALYLDTSYPTTRLKDLSSAVALEKLVMEDGRIVLKEN